MPHMTQPLPNTWTRLNHGYHEVCWSFSVSYPKNLMSNTTNNSIPLSTTINSNQISNMTRNWQPPSRHPASKPSSAIPKKKSTTNQSTPRPRRVTKEPKNLIQEKLRSTLTRPRSKTMTAFLSTKKTKPAMISTKGAGHKPTKPTWQ